MKKAAFTILFLPFIFASGACARFDVSEPLTVPLERSEEIVFDLFQSPRIEVETRSFSHITDLSSLVESGINVAGLGVIGSSHTRIWALENCTSSGSPSNPPYFAPPGGGSSSGRLYTGRGWNDGYEDHEFYFSSVPFQWNGNDPYIAVEPDASCHCSDIIFGAQTSPTARTVNSVELTHLMAAVGSCTLSVASSEVTLSDVTVVLIPNIEGDYHPVSRTWSGLGSKGYSILLATEPGVKAIEEYIIPGTYTLHAMWTATDADGQSKTYKSDASSTVTFSAGHISNLSLTLGAGTFSASVAHTDRIDWGDAKDLSYYDVDGNDTGIRTTANMYVVRQAGEYCLPLVYGNGIKDNKVNASAYTKKISNAFCHDYVNHLDNVITSPWIEDNAGCTPASCGLLWQTTAGMISDVSLDEGSDGRHCLRFTLASVPSTNGLAVVYVKDASDNIMWSWTIWATTDTMTPFTMTNHGGVDFTFLPKPIGYIWNAARTKYTQPYYQFGRKDPMCPARNCNENYNMTLYAIDGSTVSFTHYGGDYTLGANKTLGFGIKHPDYYITAYAAGNTMWTNDAELSTGNLWDSNFVLYGDRVYWENAMHCLSQAYCSKTVYDPSPRGYMVPMLDAFSGLVKNGMWEADDSPFYCISSDSDGWTVKRNYDDATGVYFQRTGYRYDGGYCDNNNSNVSYGMNRISSNFISESSNRIRANSTSLTIGYRVHVMSADAAAYCTAILPVREEESAISPAPAAADATFGGLHVSPGHLWCDGTTFHLSDTWKDRLENTQTISPYDHTVNVGVTTFSWLDLGKFFDSRGTSFTTSSGSINNGGNKVTWNGHSDWRMMTLNEWLMLRGLSSPARAGATVNGRGSSFYANVLVTLKEPLPTYEILYADEERQNVLETVSTVHGMLFFPDNLNIYGTPIHADCFDWCEWQSLAYPANAAPLTEDQLNNYIRQGCWFLPAVGMRTWDYMKRMYGWLATETSSGANATYLSYYTYSNSLTDSDGGKNGDNSHYMPCWLVR